jgi:hypothetical protein
MIFATRRLGINNGLMTLSSFSQSTTQRSFYITLSTPSDDDDDTDKNNNRACHKIHDKRDISGRRRRSKRTKMKLSTTNCALLIVAVVGGIPSGAAFSSTTRTASVSKGQLGVASPDIEKETTAAEEKKGDIPYVIARGDGSTGGGGVAMPHDTDENGLRRPKVNAEMPQG